ncbi:hypothetical protein CWATWH8502_3295 [Crocosphaera watsonii WH 8502]|uniref:Uncharacterized protein n=1 Tax=Crocosphaera watsonii WH 8502 TaxID=423474 RepID=T2I816_CROWT|nr:hypothetical protein CWATWH8502_3295 [Crocosphaera watsonii WH 8502]
MHNLEGVIAVIEGLIPLTPLGKGGNKRKVIQAISLRV